MSNDIEAVRAIVDDLFAPAVLDAVVADGWPRAMVEEGFRLHRRTWDVDAVAARIGEELADQSEPRFVESISHLWPALPGAGVTPVLYSRLAGIPRILIKPSSRGRHFGRAFVDVWRRHDGAVQWCDDAWASADHIVVSGTDTTVAAVEARVGAQRVTGYGHRVSVTIVDAGVDVSRYIDDIAFDAVMWHGLGCFSSRAVYLVGTGDRRAFARALAAAIARAEERLDARLDEPTLARRAQVRGLAEFETEVFGEGIGWVELRDDLAAASDFPHCVALLQGEPGDDHPPFQGVALAVPEGRWSYWEAVARAAGATRVCRPGELQAPPASWPHDGRPNVRQWLRSRS